MFCLLQTCSTTVADIGQVDPRTKYPFNAIMVTSGFIIALSTIGLGSAVAFNALISLLMFALVFTYTVSISCLVWRRLYGEPLPYATFSLGRLGIYVNIATLFYCAYLLIWIPWPQNTPVVANTFNWAIVEFFAIMILSLGYYFVHAKKHYQGPAAYVRKTQ